MAAEFPAPGTVPIETAVTVGDSAISRVDFYAMPAASESDNLPWSGVETTQGPQQEMLAKVKRIGTAAKAPYVTTWEQVAEGQYVIFAVAVDDNGMQQASQPSAVIVGKPQFDPQVVLPHFGATSMSTLEAESGGLIRLPKASAGDKYLLPYFPRYGSCPDVSQEIRFHASLEPNTSRARSILAPRGRLVVLATRPDYEPGREAQPGELARYRRGQRIPDNPEQAINFCPLNPNDPWNTPLQVPVSVAVAGKIGNPVTYKYYTTGGSIQQTGPDVQWDLRGLPAAVYSVIAEVNDGCGNLALPVASVRVFNHCTRDCLTFDCPRQLRSENKSSIVFHVNAPTWAVKENPIFTWRVSTGVIVRGQGTDSVEVDTSGVSSGTEVTAEVIVSGLFESCRNTVSLRIAAGDECYGIEEMASANPRVDAFPQTLSVAGRKDIRLPPGGTEVVTIVGENQPQPSPTPPTNAHGNEKEFEALRVKWPERMEIEQQERIKLSFDRVTGEVTTSNSTGSTTEIFTQSGSPLLKDRYGPDYEAFARGELAQVNFQCDACGKEVYQSLDNPSLEWSWSISPTVSGAQKPAVKLWVEWRHRQNQTKKDAVTVWSKDLTIMVKQPLLTRSTVLASSGLLGVVGTGFLGGSLFRKLKKAPTIVVAGDVVMGNKGDQYNVSGGQIGAVGPDAHVHDVKFNDPDKKT
jgi:hypothetical protein